MDVYKDDTRGWGTSDQSGEGSEKLCIKEVGIRKRWNFFGFFKEKGVGVRRTKGHTW